MSIETMTDQEKSIALARLCGWEPLSDTIDGITGHGTVFWEDEDGYMLDPEPTLPLNLYDPANMALAWRVLNWWYDYIATTDNEAVDPEDGFFDVGKLMHGVWAQPPAAAQRAWLDKILTLAIAAGMVTK